MLNENYMVEVTQVWRDKVNASRTSESRVKFMKTAAMCDHFYRGSMQTLWSESFRNEYLGGMDAPKFHVTVAKAFEAVAVMGPAIMWDYPGRVCKPTVRSKLPTEYFDSEEEYAAYLERHNREGKLHVARCGLMESYLNYAQREQPGGGLTKHSHLAITDAIVKGRGVMFTDTYSFPGSPRILTRSEFVRVEDVYIDPDCTSCNLSDCQWVAIKRRNKYWELERMFQLPKDSLKNKAKSRSRQYLHANSEPGQQADRANGLGGGDSIEWYEVFSREGVGTRSMANPPRIAQAFDRVVKDFAYLAIADDVPYPLNFPPMVANTSTDEDVRRIFDWPTPFYMDGRWPVSFLDFYTVPGSLYPIAPISMGLGELIFLNVLLSVLMERVYNSAGSILVASKGLEDDVKARLRDGNFGKAFFAEISDQNQRTIEQLVKWIESPPVPRDVFSIMSYIEESFGRRTGLTDVMYGGHAGGKVSRSASDSEMIHQRAGARVDWMTRQAEAWQTDIANNERIAAGWHINGAHLVELLGSDGADAWDKLISQEDPEVYVREMRCTLEANSISKPNKFKDNATIQATLQYVLPLMQQYWQMSGDPTPLNSYLDSVAKAMEHDGDEWKLPVTEPPQPDPDEEEAKAIAAEKMKEELEGRKLRNLKLRQDTGGLEEDAQADRPPPAELPPEFMGGQLMGAGEYQEAIPMDEGEGVEDVLASY